MSSMTDPDECNPKATFLLLNPWGPFRSYVNQRVANETLTSHSVSLSRM